MSNTPQVSTEESNTEATHESTVDLIVLTEQRSATYGLLSRLFRAEIDEDLLHELHGLHWRVSTGNERVDEGHKLIANYLSGIWENTLTELAADYLRVFFGHGYDGHAAAYPFESVYSSEKRLLMQSARDEVLSLYRAEGLDKQSSWKEGEDHIALELEYLQILSVRCEKALKEGNNEEAYRLVKCQANFMEEHLGAWAPLLCEQMRNFAKTDFYRGLASLAQGFLETDTALMNDLLSEAA